MLPTPPTRATLDDLYRVEGKAELVAGRIVHLPLSGDLPSEVAGEILIRLHAYAKVVGQGKAKGEGIGYAVPELPSGRESFSPDVSYHIGPRPTNRMRFIEGAPIFAVEVRSENDYGPAEEQKMADKRIDYFAAGTLVVWDVDPLAECVHVYRSTQPTHAVTYHRGGVAEAEPAVPGWRLAVDELFAE
jgi:Uma2 family endonuclease